MRLSPGVLTFLIGLVILAAAGLFYQQSLMQGGAYQAGGTSTSEVVVAANVKYVCPMRCVEADEPGECPACGMDMTPIEQPLAVGTIDQAAYTCPMHPHIVQDREGTCPICGMELVPKEADSTAVDSATREAVQAVKLSPLQSVLADISPIHATYEPVALTVPAIGQVVVPEDQENEIVSWQAGRVDNLYVRDTGSEVKKGELLLDIYSEELIQAQEEYLLALEAVDRLGDSRYESISAGSRRLFDASRQKLLRLGMTAAQLAALESTRQVQDHLPVYASHGGTVMGKSITEGMYVKEGSPLYTVANLGTVWVEVEIFERDMSELAIGNDVTLSCPIHPGMTFEGVIVLIEPSIDPATRTHRARVVIDNPDLILRPGMIMDASLTVSHDEMILLPRNAVLHTGDGDLVYLLVGENMWEPRRVTIGRDFGDKVEIVAGITTADAVAGTAVFLLDSEAQLKGIQRPINSDVMEPAEGGHGGHQH